MPHINKAPAIDPITIPAISPGVMTWLVDTGLGFAVSFDIAAVLVTELAMVPVIELVAI